MTAPTRAFSSTNATYAWTPPRCTPPAEAARAAIDPAELTDRIDQAWITPLDLEDDYGPRSHITDKADRFLRMNHIPTAATDPEDSPVVHWPEPSPLESWWNTIMRPARPM